METKSLLSGSGVDRRPLSRRGVILGTLAVLAAAVSAAGSLAMQWSRSARQPLPAAVPRVPASVATPGPETTPSLPVEVQPTAATPRSATVRTLENSGLPDGMVFVASPRMPVGGVGPEDPWRMLTGQITNWAAVGSAVPYPVRPVALAEATVAGIRAEQSFDTYDALAAALALDRGAVALLPTDIVDFRVQTLTVGEVDALLTPVKAVMPVRIGVVGDIVPGRNVHLHMVDFGDFTRPFHHVAALLRSFDLTVANLEGNLSESLPQPADPHSVTFVSNPAMLEGFAQAGIDAVTLANNHTVWNDEGWGDQGLLDTIAALNAYGVPYFGAGTNLETARAPLVREVNGTRIALIGIDGVTANYEAEPGRANGVLDVDAGATADGAGTNPYLGTQIFADIRAATTVADLVIPYFHFGAEYVAVPPLWSVQAAHMAIDAGAGMVVTNHPHVIQGMEIYANKPIVYSPGNFILDQMWAAEVRSGYALEIVVRGANIVGLRFHGVEIEDFHQPRLMTSGEQAALMDRFWAATDRLASRESTTT